MVIGRSLGIKGVEVICEKDDFIFFWDRDVGVVIGVDVVLWVKGYRFLIRILKKKKFFKYYYFLIIRKLVIVFFYENIDILGILILLYIVLLIIYFLI